MKLYDSGPWPTQYEHGQSIAKRCHSIILKYLRLYVTWEPIDRLILNLKYRFLPLREQMGLRFTQFRKTKWLPLRYFTISTPTCCGGWLEGASCWPGALRAKGEQKADLFVVSVLRHVGPVCVRSCLCLLPVCRGWFPSSIGLARRHISEIPLSTT